MVMHARAVYATQPHPLKHQIATLLKEAPATDIEGDVCAIIVPDTNLLQGGRVAAEVYKALGQQQFDSVILIAPSHTATFQRINICKVDHYQSPLGTLSVNDKIRNELCDEDDDIFLGDEGHFHPEGVDVQLPFLQTCQEGFDIVPIVMGNETPSFCRELGHAIAEVSYNRRILVVACANVVQAGPEDLDSFNQYIEGCDVDRMMILLNSERVVLQGKGAVLVAMIAATQRRHTKAQVLQLQPPHGPELGYLGAVLWRD